VSIQVRYLTALADLVGGTLFRWLHNGPGCFCIGPLRVSRPPWSRLTESDGLPSLDMCSLHTIRPFDIPASVYLDISCEKSPNVSSGQAPNFRKAMVHLALAAPVTPPHRAPTIGCPWRDVGEFVDTAPNRVASDGLVPHTNNKQCSKQGGNWNPLCNARLAWKALSRECRQRRPHSSAVPYLARQATEASDTPVCRPLALH
jgi:hypothetical protein